MLSSPFPSQALLNLPATYDFVRGLFYHDHVAPDVSAYMSFYLPTELGALWGTKPPLCIPGLNHGFLNLSGEKKHTENSDLESSLVTLPSASVTVNL